VLRFYFGMPLPWFEIDLEKSARITGKSVNWSSPVKDLSGYYTQEPSEKLLIHPREAFVFAPVFKSSVIWEDSAAEIKVILHGDLQ